jgi:hypothetical protein
MKKDIIDKLDIMLRVDTLDKKINAKNEHGEDGFIINHKFYNLWDNELIFWLNFQGHYISGFYKRYPFNTDKFYKFKINFYNKI